MIRSQVSIFVAGWWFSCLIVGTVCLVDNTKDISLSEKNEQESSVEGYDETLDSKERYTFEEYVNTFGKSYSTRDEYELRQSIFEENLEQILTHNNAKEIPQIANHVLSINHLADLKSSELPRGFDKGQHGAWNPTVSSLPGSNAFEEWANDLQMDDPKKLPTTVDWRTINRADYMTDVKIDGSESILTVASPVKNQGHCGSCWAFAISATLETHVALQTEDNTLFSFSPQSLVSCSKNPYSCGGTGGCQGSTGEIALDFVRTHGMVSEWEFGYQSYYGDDITCSLDYQHDGSNLMSQTHLRPSKTSGVSTQSKRRQQEVTASDRNWEPLKGAVATVEGYVVLPTNNYTVMMNAIAKTGPVAISVAASNWHLYKKGVFTDLSTSKSRFDINHLVVLMGYGTDPETKEDYWLVRNSWGPLWGEAGYIRLRRFDPSTVGSDTMCGMDVTPSHGDACTKDAEGNPVIPPPVKVCGTSGILFEGIVPVGGRLV